jgi:MtfA peptidase
MPTLDWLRRALGRPGLASIPDRMWQQVTDRMPFLVGLSSDEMTRLRALTQDFLATKEFSAASGFHLDDEICLSIAIQGCLPILNLDLDWYRGWHGIIVYPDEFVIPRQTMDEDGVVHAYDEIASGEAWSDGPVLISWQDVEMSGDGYNVVIHEFAHKLDMLNGDPDGLPPLHKGMSRREWMQTLEAAYEALCAEVDASGEDEPECFLDPYAAEHPAEFFAVASEAFFDSPHDLRAEYPALYEQFVRFYRQDPAARLPAPQYEADESANNQ